MAVGGRPVSSCSLISCSSRSSSSAALTFRSGLTSLLKWYFVTFSIKASLSSTPSGHLEYYGKIAELINIGKIS